MDQPEVALAMLNEFVHTESRPVHKISLDALQDA